MAAAFGGNGKCEGQTPGADVEAHVVVGLVLERAGVSQPTTPDASVLEQFGQGVSFAVCPLVLLAESAINR